jgi:Bacteriorhodopsin
MGPIIGQAAADQPALASQIAETGLLAESLWINVALAGLTILAIAAVARGVTTPRAQLIIAATLFVPVVSLASYSALISGLTVSLTTLPAAHPAGGAPVLTLWGRYLTWTISTPLILLALGLLAGSNLTKLFIVISADIAMCVTGLAAALTVSSVPLRWGWFAISTVFFLVVLYMLLVEWGSDAERAGSGEIFQLLRTLTVVLWVGYPITWAVGAEGLALLGIVGSSWAYSLLDIGAKYVFALLLVRWVVAHERRIGRYTPAQSPVSAD